MLSGSVLSPPVSPDMMSLMKKLIQKIKDKGKKDPANFSEKKLKKLEEENAAKAMEEFKKSEIQKEKDIQIIQKELIKYKDNEKELLELHKSINQRFNVSKTMTKAKIWGVASVYFNALDILGLPENYYPTFGDEPFPPPGNDPHIQLFEFQCETSHNDCGHSIPTRPGKPNQYVIHGFLFPMTSTTIHLERYTHEKNKFKIIYHPNDELFYRDWGSTLTTKYFKTYEEAFKEFEKTIDNHLEQDEEYFYNAMKDISYR